MVVVNTIANAFGARWYDMGWKAQFLSPEMRKAFAFYKHLLDEGAEAHPEKYGYLECLELMASGKAAMWYDATVGGGNLEGKDSAVAGKVGYAMAPAALKGNTGWLWAWALAIESSSRNKDAAFKFITWATSKEYIELVGEREGWARVPPGSRRSTYANPKYRSAVPFADIVLASIVGADYTKPTVSEVPYTGIQYLSIPAFQEIGEQVSQYVVDYVTGRMSIDETLAACQEAADLLAVKAGYRN